MWHCRELSDSQVLLWQNRRIYGWWVTGCSHSLTQYHQHAWPSLAKWYQVSFKYPKCAKEIKNYKQHHKYKEVERICSIKRRKPPSLKLAIVLATRARTYFKIKVSFRPRIFNHFFPKGQKSWKRWDNFWAFRFLGEWLLFCRWCHMHQQVQIVQFSCHMYKTYICLRPCLMRVQIQLHTDDPLYNCTTLRSQRHHAPARVCHPVAVLEVVFPRSFKCWMSVCMWGTWDLLSLCNSSKQ